MKFSKGQYIKTLPCGNQCSQECYSSVNADDVNEYLKLLLQSGYTQYNLSALNGNIFATLSKSGKLLNLNYTKHDSTLRVLCDPLIETYFKVTEPPYQKITDTSLAIIPLDYSHREIADAHGMCYAITLEDGRFIVIDGGYDDYFENGTKKEPRDAEILFEYLSSHNKRNEKIIIAAWIFTHPHADHCGAFFKFNRLYRNDIEIQHFIYNDGDPSTYAAQYQPEDFLRDKLPKIIRDEYKNAKIIKPHISQSFSFCNLTITAIFTQEALAPYIKPAPNDASLILRFEINGTSLLFMADADQAVSNLLTTIYGNMLKSNIMQVNHHGYSGATCGLYDCVSPEYTMWTTSQIAFEKRTSGEKYKFIGNAVESNKYIFDKLGSAHCLIADKKVTTVTFKSDGYFVN